MKSIKCPHCGLINFASADICKRCEKGLDAPPVTEEVAPADTSAPVAAAPPGSKVKWLLIVAAAVVLCVAGYGAVSNWRETRAKEAAAEKERKLKEALRVKNREAGLKAIEQLRRLQSATEGGIAYMQYGELVTAAKVETDAALRSFLPVDDADRDFVSEVNLATLRFIAARESWSTAIKYSSVTSTEERDEWLDKHWAEAVQHIDAAERILAEKTFQAVSAQP